MTLAETTTDTTPGLTGEINPKRVAMSCDGGVTSDGSLLGDEPVSDEFDGARCTALDGRMDQSGGKPLWLHSLCRTEFFNPCSVHNNLSKNHCVFFCLGCSPQGRPMCRHCLGDHGCRDCTVFQIRRYMYKNVVHVHDLGKFCDISDVQAYCINQRRAVLLKGKGGQQGSGAPAFDTHCATCSVPLRPDCTYCSLECKIEECVGPRTPSASKHCRQSFFSFPSDSDTDASPEGASLRHRRERQVQSRYRPYDRRRKPMLPVRSPFE